MSAMRGFLIHDIVTFHTLFCKNTYCEKRTVHEVFGEWRICARCHMVSPFVEEPKEAPTFEPLPSLVGTTLEVSNVNS